MILHPGGLLGLPPGVPSVVWDVAWWRNLLLLVALAAAFSEARARRRAALAFALIFAALAVGFWVAALGRPYGVLVDPATTRWAADLTVAGWAGGTERFLAGEPGRDTGWTRVARAIRPDLVLLIPSLLPVVVLPAGAALIAGLWRSREAGLAAMFWLGASTGALDLLRGAGFLSSLWARPRASVLWLLTLSAVLVLSRLDTPARARFAPGALGVLAWCALGRQGPDLGLAETVLALTLDHHLWLVAGAAALWRNRDPAASALVAGGAALCLVRALGGPGDLWAGLAFVRTGLVLAVAEGIASLAPAPGPTAPLPGGMRRGRLPQAALVAVVLGSGLLAWWDPPRTDAVARLSLEPYPEALVEAMGWIREHTPARASWLADEDYPAALAVLAGRRVLRAPGLLEAPDEERRLRLQRATLAGRPPRALQDRYGLGYVFVAPGHFREAGLSRPEDLARRFLLRYANAKGMHVFEISPPAVREGRSVPIK